MRINKIDMWVSTKSAANLLLGVNIMLMLGFVFTLMFILLERSPDLQDWAYNATYEIQPLIIYSWFLSILLSPVLAIVLSFLFGYKIRNTTQWKISIVVMVFIGMPSLLFAVSGYFMRGI